MLVDSYGLYNPSRTCYWSSELEGMLPFTTGNFICNRIPEQAFPPSCCPYRNELVVIGGMTVSATWKLDKH